jgi:phenylacetic acid degradation protein
MANIFEFEGARPVIDASAYIHPNATVIGNVTIGRDVYVGPGAVLRGDWGKIIIGDGSNVQENCVLHSFPNAAVILERDSHIGHNVVIHGATIGANTLVGMGAVIMDNAVIGKECIIGALALVTANMKVPDRKVLMGSPAKIVKDVTDDALAWKNAATKVYQTLPARYRDTLKPCEPLREAPENVK